MGKRKMTDAELLAEAEALDRAYAESAAWDATHGVTQAGEDPGEETAEDEMALLMRAGLNRGAP